MNTPINVSKYIFWGVYFWIKYKLQLEVVMLSRIIIIIIKEKKIPKCINHVAEIVLCVVVYIIHIYMQ